MLTIEHHTTDLGTIVSGVITSPLGDKFATGTVELFDTPYSLPLIVEVRIATIPEIGGYVVDSDVYDHRGFFVDGRTNHTDGIVATLTAAIVAARTAKVAFA